MNSDVLLFGNGFLGKRIMEEWPVRLSRKRILTLQDAETELETFRPKIVINAIGHTGEGNVDGCEKARDKTLQANTIVPLILAEACYRRDIKLVHISSGCIYHFDYDHQSAITENDPPDYFNLYYSRTKIYAESALKDLAHHSNILIPRVRVPLDNRPHPKNLLTKLINYKRIINAPNSITYIPDFIKALKHLIQVDARGIFNVVSSEPLYYDDLLKPYARSMNDFEYTIIDVKELNLDRTNLILSTEKLQRTGFHVRAPREIIEECVNDYIHFSSQALRAL